MPEKPEVLTVVKALKSRIIGKTIKDVVVRWDNNKKVHCFIYNFYLGT